MFVFPKCLRPQSGSADFGVTGNTALVVYNRVVVVVEMVIIVQELCECRGGRPGPSVLTSVMVSVDVK